jgi:UrcA family protein
MFKSHRVTLQRVVLAALPTLFMVGSAFAAVAAEAPPAVTVRYSDLNLNSTQDVASLYKRIEYAAREVCRPAEGPQVVSEIHSTAWNECFYHAIAKAVRSVHNDKLSAYHWQHIRGWGYQGADASTTVARR